MVARPVRRFVTILLVAVAAFATGFAVRGCVVGGAPDARDGRSSAPPTRETPAEVTARARPSSRRATAPDVPAATQNDSVADESSPSAFTDAPANAERAPEGELIVRGRCVDPSGAPVSGVAVLPASPFSWRASTASDGRFEVPADPNDKRYLRLVPDAGFAPRRVPLPEPSDGRIDLGDVVLSVGGTIRGVFLDLDDRPVAGAPLLLHDIDATCSARGGVSTDREGRFVFAHVPEGRVCISGRSPGAPIPAPEQDAQLWPVRAGDDIVLRIRSRHFVRFDYVDETGSTVRIAGPRVRWFALDDPADGETWDWEGGWWSACHVPVRSGARYEIQFEIDGWLPLTHRFEGGEEALKRETLVFRRAAR